MGKTFRSDQRLNRRRDRQQFDAIFRGDRTNREFTAPDPLKHIPGEIELRQVQEAEKRRMEVFGVTRMEAQNAVNRKRLAESRYKAGNFLTNMAVNATFNPHIDAVISSSVVNSGLSSLIKIGLSKCELQGDDLWLWFIACLEGRADDHKEDNQFRYDRYLLKQRLAVAFYPEETFRDADILYPKPYAILKRMMDAVNITLITDVVSRPDIVVVIGRWYKPSAQTLTFGDFLRFCQMRAKAMEVERKKHTVEGRHVKL